MYSRFLAAVSAALFILIAQPVIAQDRSHHKVIVVTTTIQDAVNKAKPGTTIKIPAGTYYESVNIPTNLTGLTLLGSNGAIIDATGFTNGIQSFYPGPIPDAYVTPEVPCSDAGIKGLTIKGLTIRNANENGIFLAGATKFRILNCILENDGEYGVFPTCCEKGLIANCTCSGHTDAGIYVGIDTDISVLYNTTFSNAIGIEIENSIFCSVQYNDTYNNAVGILFDIGPNIPIKENAKLLAAFNNIHDNINPYPNPDFGIPGVEVTPDFTPVGLLLFGGGPVVLFENTFTNNGAAEFAAIDLPIRWWGLLLRAIQYNQENPGISLPGISS